MIRLAIPGWWVIWLVKARNRTRKTLTPWITVSSISFGIIVCLLAATGKTAVTVFSALLLSFFLNIWAVLKAPPDKETEKIHFALERSRILNKGEFKTKRVKWNKVRVEFVAPVTIRFFTMKREHIENTSGFYITRIENIAPGIIDITFSKKPQQEKREIFTNRPEPRINYDWQE